MADQVAIPLQMEAGRAEALAQLVKRVLRQNLGASGLNLADPHRQGDDWEMEQALHDLRHALASAGFDPR